MWQKQKGPCSAECFAILEVTANRAKNFCISKESQLVKWKFSKENVDICGLKDISKYMTSQLKQECPR